jgi:XTP/dITP diphosphohydrolase
MALVLPDGTEHVRLGVMPGHLTRAPAGGNGFGYDPLFVADGHERTTAQLEPAAKDAISHRGQAIRALVPVLVDELRRSGAAAAQGAR